MTFSDKIALIDLILKLVAGLGAALAFAFGYHQFKKSQNWQKAQVLLALIDSFEKDERIECACQMLDWDEREVRLSGKEVINFTNSMLPQALRTSAWDSTGKTTPGECFTQTESLIRDCFDAFFDFFHKLYAFRRSGLLEFGDLTYFNYWFELLLNIEDYKGVPGLRQGVLEYIKAYRFIGMQQLMEEYSQRPDPLLLPREGISPKDEGSTSKGDHR